MTLSLNRVEARVGEGYDNLQAVFTAQTEAFRAVGRARQAEEKGITVAPEGYLLRIVALTDKTLTKLMDVGSTHEWQLEREAGTVEIAPMIDPTHSEGLVTTWHPMRLGIAGSVLGEKYKWSPTFQRAAREGGLVRINNKDFELGFISWKEFEARAFSSDRTLYHDPVVEAAARALKGKKKKTAA